MSIAVRELTPRGRGAVSVIEISGSGSREAVRALAPRADLNPGSLCLVRLCAAGDDLDEALVCVLGADHIELHVHGSPTLVRVVIQRLRAQVDAPVDARIACSPSPGWPLSPSARHGALEQRALDRLADAPSAAGARVLLDQAEGALRHGLHDLLALPAGLRRDPIEALIRRARALRFALQPARVVLSGPVNAGKSTLFNLLVGEHRALVGAEPGTTRDVIRERAFLGDYPVDLFDTAGQREIPGDAGDSAIERAGQSHAARARESAELTVWLEPLTAEPGPSAPVFDGPYAHPVIVLRTCADRVPHPERAGIEHAISALFDPGKARAVVEQAFLSALEFPERPWIPGAAVPFDESMISALAALREAPSDPSRERTLIDFLESP